jgi:hypothetical protein
MFYFRPDYAKNAPANDEYDDEEEEEDKEEKEQTKTTSGKLLDEKEKYRSCFLVSHNEQEDRRLRRLQARQLDEGDNERDR